MTSRKPGLESKILLTLKNNVNTNNNLQKRNMLVSGGWFILIAIGLAIIVIYYRNSGTIKVQEIDKLKG